MMTDTQAKSHAPERATFCLRLLETTDVHGHLLPYDYYTNQPVTGVGLARTATLIRQARRECCNCLLLDNGDYLQGTPISDLMPLSETDPNRVHPAILAMNTLQYDAAALGNHEFNFGLEWLQATLEKAVFPITCANLRGADQAETQAPLFAPYVLLDRVLRDGSGLKYPICIGVIGLAPPQTTMWDHFHLQGRVKSLDMLETARRLVPEMRAKGADLVIALAHTGIDPGPITPMMENAALPLAALPGIDAVLAGHTHQVFPSDAFTAIEGVHPANGTLHGTPAVMAGARGSHLGVLDLELARRGKGAWSVISATSEARPVQAQTQTDAKLRRLLKPAHEITLKLTSRPLGMSDRPLHTYLAMVTPGAATAVVTRAQRDAVARLLQGTKDQDIPLLSASAPFKTGGRAGPHYYTDIPPGALCLRHAADLYSFPNLLCALRLTGAEIREWLERASIVFHQITPGQQGQVLRDGRVPGHHFDMIDGVSYQIDLSSPPRYDLSGHLCNPAARRIRALRYKGRRVQEDEMFILATNNFRAFGGGPFPVADAGQFALTGTQMLRDVLADYFLALRDGNGTLPDTSRNWRFCPMPGTQVLFETGPGLRRYPQDIAALGARDLGDTDAGFTRLALPL